MGAGLTVSILRYPGYEGLGGGMEIGARVGNSEVDLVQYAVIEGLGKVVGKLFRGSEVISPMTEKHWRQRRSIGDLTHDHNTF
jgi:hypothetical protein